MIFRLNENREKEALMKYISSLIDLNSSLKDSYLEILIKHEDCEMVNVDVNQKTINSDFNSSYELVDCDNFIAKEIRLPDDTIEIIPASDDEQDYIDEFQRAHPGEYALDSFGHWYNVAEQKAWEKQLKKEEKAKKGDK